MANNWDEPIGLRFTGQHGRLFAGGQCQPDRQTGLFGSVVKTQPRGDNQAVVYGLLYDMHIDDDPMVRQLCWPSRQ